ncbi:MAG: putative toxin-antitoxin system toxin component, PIN family, partial [Steroidobacteraceae bacterium]
DLLSMRVVFDADANVYVSALTLPGGHGARALNVAVDGHVQLLASREIVLEVLGVLKRKFARDREELARVAVFLADATELITPVSRVKVLKDEPDNRILECAVSGKAERIVTGDRAMLALRSFRGISIISLRQFLVDHGATD